MSTTNPSSFQSVPSHAKLRFRARAALLIQTTQYSQASLVSWPGRAHPGSAPVAPAVGQALHQGYWLDHQRARRSSEPRLPHHPPARLGVLPGAGPTLSMERGVGPLGLNLGSHLRCGPAPHRAPVIALASALEGGGGGGEG
eukprot:6792699-Alexandrium_andersonii.AAC.1